MIGLWIAKELCTGCGVCANICPRNAIKMCADSMGFLYPQITGNCTECGKCKAVCDNRIEEGKKSGNPVVYAAWSKDEKIRFLSTSGGIFSELANSIINMGGIVSGAQYTENCLVEHGIADDVLSLDKLRQSKYVQSDSKDIYRKIKEFLRTGKKILFCGTPCQVAALQAYLQQEDISNLYTIDFICMGVNSPKAYLAWLSEIEKKKNKKVQKVWFKYKKNGWKKSPFVTRICFADETWMEFSGEDNIYMQSFLKHRIIIRPCCGNCQFKGITRQADITLGDFWGIDPALDDDKGVSMIMINNEKGKELFCRISPGIVFNKKSIEDVIRGNAHIYKSVKVSENEKRFFCDLNDLSFSAALDKLKNV